MTTPVAPIGCIVLAAGSAQRFGSDKRLARLPTGDTLLTTSLTRIPTLFAPRLLVLRPGEAFLAQQAPDWQTIFAPRASLGMGHSLATAITHLILDSGSELHGVVIALGDMPEVAPTTFTAVAAALRPDTMVVPRFQGKRGNPVGIGAKFFPALTALQGDQGARGLFQQYPTALHWLDVDDPGILYDIDSPEHLPPD